MDDVYQSPWEAGTITDQQRERRVRAIEIMTEDQLRSILSFIAGYNPELFDRVRFEAL